MSAFYRTSFFDEWLHLLKDKTGKALILKRTRAAEAGNFGDCQPVGQGVSEMRVHLRARLSGVLYAHGWRGVHATPRWRQEQPAK